MNRKILAVLLLVVGVFALASRLTGDAKQTGVSGFVVEHELVLPASPEAVYDAITGDISPWWDHHFSANPKKFYIEPRPGGGFYEIFNDAGDGVLHATVIFAQRGKRLRFTGPFGFSGSGVDLVVTYDLKPEGGGTRFHLTCAVTGQVSEAGAQGVDQVWRHFLFERLKPYIESGEYKKHQRAPGGKQ